MPCSGSSVEATPTQLQLDNMFKIFRYSPSPHDKQACHDSRKDLFCAYGIIAILNPEPLTLNPKASIFPLPRQGRQSFRSRVLPDKIQVPKPHAPDLELLQRLRKHCDISTIPIHHHCLLLTTLTQPSSNRLRFR